MVMAPELIFLLVINECRTIFAVIRSLLAKIQIFELFDWLKFFEGNSQRNFDAIGPFEIFPHYD
jgi:hypothetical protein